MNSHKRQLDEYHARRTVSPEPRKMPRYRFYGPNHPTPGFDAIPGGDRFRIVNRYRGPIRPPPNHPLGITRAMRNWANFIRALWD